MTRAYDEVLNFWFGDLDAEGRASPEHVKKWWTKDPAFDARCREHFGRLHEEIMSGAHEDWRDTARGCLGSS